MKFKRLTKADLHGVKVETNVPCLKDKQESYYQNIAAHLMDGAELIVKPEEARRTIAVIETTEKSALAGKELPVPLEGQQHYIGRRPIHIGLFVCFSS